MTSAAPLLNTSYVVDGVCDLLAQATKYYSPSDFQIRRLATEANKVLQANPAIGHLVLAFTKQLSGDGNSVRHHLENAIRFGAPRQQVAEVAMTCFTNLGMFSDAMSSYREAGDPQSGRFTHLYYLAGSCGAFRQIARFEETAMRMHLDLSGIDKRDLFRHANEVLEKTRTTDEEIATLLDIAGEVMRARGLFFIGPSPDICVLDDDETDCCVFLTFAVSENPEIAAEMMFDLAELAADKMPRIPPGFSVSFSSVQ